MSPLYDFQCDSCGEIQERFFHMDNCPDSVLCNCGKQAKKIMSIGGIETDNDVTWLPSAVKTLQPDHERSITTRTEYKKYLKDKGITPIG